MAAFFLPVIGQDRAISSKIPYLVNPIRDTLLRVFILIIFVAACQLGLTAQLDNSSLFFNRNIDTLGEKKFFIKIQNLDYMKNNEYAGLLADGYTLFGVQLNPQLGYQLNKHLAIEAGAFFMKDFGVSSFKELGPTFSLRYQKKDFKMVFGNLDGSLNHQLIEPLYNFERVVTNRLESGAQFVLNKKYFDLDAWIDWQKGIYRQSANREQLWAGINVALVKLKTESLELAFPFQGTVLHTGGQIDTSREKTVRNINYSPGITFKYHFGKKNAANVYADARFVFEQRELYDSLVFKTNGYGFMGNIGMNAFKTNLMFSYWYGTNYRSDFGGYLYSSESSSVHFAGSYETYRSLIIMRITRVIELAPNVILTLRVEPYYDVNQGLFEYSYGFYINFDEKFWFRKS